MKIDTTTSMQATNSTTARNARLHSAAQQFEAVLLGQMLKPMEKAFTGDGDENNVLGSYATESLAGALAQRGVLGIDQMLEKSVAAKNNASQP